MLPEPPRKYHVDEDLKRDYDDRIGPKLDVLLDGNIVTKVTAYDCDAGTVDRFKSDANGLAYLNKDRTDVERETLRGEVTVRWREPTHA